MPVKPTRTGDGRVDVDAHANPQRRPDNDSSRADTPGRHDVDAVFAGHTSTTRAQPVGDSDLDAILPAPTVTVHLAPAPDIRLNMSQPLESYRIAATIRLPDADSDGFRMHNKRRYVDMADGGIVLVAVDPDTGLFRARRANELLASGPMLRRDADSGLWHPLTDTEANAAALSDTSLRPSGVQPSVVVASTRAQVKRYFPEATDLHADDFIARFGNRDAAEAELKRLELQFPQLDREVKAWEAAYKGDDDAERSRRLTIGDKFRRLYKWQGEPSEKVYRDGQLSGFKLEMDLGSHANLKLPIFSTRLNAVVSLSLTGRSVQKLEDLFSMFSHVQDLTAVDLGVNGRKLLSALHKLPDLKRLKIIHAEFWQRESNVVQFAGLTGLQELNLSGSDLAGCSVSVRGLSDMRVLNLSSTNLLGLPLGLKDSPGLSRLEVLDLHDNLSMRSAPDITGMADLRILDLTWTGIEQLITASGSAGGPSRLEVLRLKGNYLRIEPSLRGMTALRELDLTSTGITRMPVELGSDGGPLGLEILKLGSNWLRDVPSLRGMPALREVDLSTTGIDRFPEGVTSEVPGSSLNLGNNRIVSIPEDIELRKGFDLSVNPIADAASFRRLIAARRQTGTDIWLERNTIWEINDRTPDIWMKDVPQAQQPEKLELWRTMMSLHMEIPFCIQRLRYTPEFQVERQLLQRRVWSVLENFLEADPVAQNQLKALALNERSAGKMLDEMEEVIRSFDSGRQNQPLHHLPKRPKLN